jgi:ABC-type polysaccharide/polyol phosphate export permease
MTAPSSEAVAPGPTRAVRKGLVQLVAEGLGELAGRQRLIRYMVGANLKRTHADTVLGQLWWVLDPLLLMLIYVVLVGLIFRRATPDYPLFIFAAVLPWKWFSATLNAASTSVTGRESLLRQVPFPKLVLPVSATIASTVSFGVSLIALALMYAIYLDRLTPWVLAIPLVAAVQFVFTLALAIALGAVNAFYRDVQNVLGHALRLWFYLSPGLYSIDEVTKGPVHTLLKLNPMAPILESYRFLIWGTENTGGVAPDFFGLAWVLGLSLVLLVLAIAVFKKVEPAFARII